MDGVAIVAAAAADGPTLHAARRGDRAAVAVLLRELQDPWYRFALSLLGDADRAMEAAQESGLRFLKLLPGFRGDSRLQTWALGIALNVVREMRRKDRPLPEEGQRHLVLTRAAALATAGGDASPLASADGAEQRQRLRELLARLPDRQREAITLRFFEDLSVQETAELMNCAEGTVKATVHQALRSMKSKLTEPNHA
jgi:RNA polymerase sigma-70 factor (ECF subfamily)